MNQITYDAQRIAFTGGIYESEALDLATSLRERAPARLAFDLMACTDLHTAILQLLLAYKAEYDADFALPEKPYAFVCAIEGFGVYEDDSD